MQSGWLGRERSASAGPGWCELSGDLRGPDVDGPGGLIGTLGGLVKSDLGLPHRARPGSLVILDFALRALQRVADAVLDLPDQVVARVSDCDAPDAWDEREVAEEPEGGAEGAHQAASVAWGTGAQPDRALASEGRAPLPSRCLDTMENRMDEDRPSDGEIEFERQATIEGRLGALEVMVALLIDDATQDPAKAQWVAQAYRRAAALSRQSNEDQAKVFVLEGRADFLDRRAQRKIDEALEGRPSPPGAD